MVDASDAADAADAADAVEVPITDELDLHTFDPRDVADLVANYVDECRARGFTVVRVIHGKGTGSLRRTVHAALERHPGVLGHRGGGDGEGGWGATVVTLRPL